MAAWRSTREWNTPRLRRRLVSLAKKPSTAFSHDAEVGGKWKAQRGGRASHARALGGVWLGEGAGPSGDAPAWVPGQPRQDLGVLVAGVVVEHDVDDLTSRDVAFEAVEEPQELLVPVALHALAGHRAVQDIERGEQGGGAVADVVVGERAGPTPLHRQSRLGAIQRLNLALLVD